MATVGDIYRIKDTQIMNGDFSNPFLNVYYYQAVSGVGGTIASNVGAAFITTVMTPMLAVQSVALQHTVLEITNLNDPTDFDSQGFTPPAGQGTRTGSWVPNALTWSFIYRRATLLVRNGWKRIGGIVEDDVANGTVAPSILGALALVADGMENDLLAGGGTLEPKIVRVTGPTGGPFVYTPFPISGVDFVHVGTQNSRKR